jgi:acyl-CoA thioester hydrolase
MLAHETRLRVRYAETDQMGVVYYANYLVWMEVGRVEYCRASGVQYRDLEIDAGILLAVVDAQCRYISPARYDEEIVIKTWVETPNPRAMRFQYEMRAAHDNRLIATGETNHIFCGRDMKPKKLPQQYRASFGMRV